MGGWNRPGVSVGNGGVSDSEKRGVRAAGDGSRGWPLAGVRARGWRRLAGVAACWGTGARLADAGRLGGRGALGATGGRCARACLVPSPRRRRLQPGRARVVAALRHALRATRRVAPPLCASPSAPPPPRRRPQSRRARVARSPQHSPARQARLHPPATAPEPQQAATPASHRQPLRTPRFSLSDTPPFPTLTPGRFHPPKIKIYKSDNLYLLSKTIIKIIGCWFSLPLFRFPPPKIPSACKPSRQPVSL